MTTKPNNEDKGLTFNNYFYIPNDLEFYKIGVSDIVGNSVEISFAYYDRRISIPNPTNEGLYDYNWLVELVKQTLMDEDVCPYKIKKITRFFAGIQDDVTEKILQIRRE